MVNGTFPIDEGAGSRASYRNDSVCPKEPAHWTAHSHASKCHDSCFPSPPLHGGRSIQISPGTDGFSQASDQVPFSAWIPPNVLQPATWSVDTTPSKGIQWAQNAGQTFQASRKQTPLGLSHVILAN